MREHRVGKLYIKLFDVKPGSEESYPDWTMVPAASTTFLQPLPEDMEVVPVVYITVVDDRDYASASDVIGALAEGSTIDAIEWLNDEQTTGVVAVSCPSTGRSIALISYESNTEMYVVDFFNTEAVAQGVVDEWLGDNYGTSVDEIWETVFGYTPGA